jgi:uncharacterized protein (TIGR03067 family)
MRRSALLLVVVLSLAFAPAPLPRPKQAQGDAKQLQGTWLLTGEVYEGRPEPPRELQMIIAGNRLTFSVNGVPADSYDITLDAKARPRAMDLKGRGPGERPLYLASYSVEGDVLAFSWHKGGGTDRPADLSGNGPREWRSTYQRQKR